jgi:tetratricopeptide (TPR) repeat protein
MIRRSLIVAAAAALALLAGPPLLAYHGFGGGGRGFGGGGFRGGGFGGGYGGFRSAGFGGGYGGGVRGYGGYGGMSSFARTPSFSAPHSYATGYGTGYGSRGAYEGLGGGQINYGSRSGTYNTARGGAINYGAAGAAGRGPYGGEAGRGVYGVSGNTAGGRTFADVGRVGGAVGPGGGAVAGRSNLAAVSGPRGTAVEGSRAYGVSGSRPYGFNAYGGYHSGWVHGYWNGHDHANWAWRNPYWGGWGWGLGLGLGLGWGLSSWGYGSSLYGMGYLPYSNPYYDDYYGGAAGVPVASSPYNYGQLIDTTAAPADESVTTPAEALFDAARAAFQQGNYTDALAQSDAALAKLPNDTSLHEFRALCLFALGRYDEAAAAVYAVLSVGPGWDWATLIGLYSGVETYTAQLRALEAYCRDHPTSASARFVLAYHYLTQSHIDAAVGILKDVVALKPGDSLSAKLLKQLDAPKEVTEGTAPAQSTAQPAPESVPPAGATIAGTWNAHPAAETRITLTIQPDGSFTWQVAQKNQTRSFSGKSTYGEGMLTLVQDQGPALVGRVDWKDANQIAFHVVGDGPDDPGLNFAR